MITAVTITEPVAAWLQTKPRRLRVHSVFPQAINLVSDDRQFLTLLARDADDGPFALRLACPRLPDVPAVTAGCAAHGTIFLGSLVIDWRSATRWDPTLKPIDKTCAVPLGLLDCLHRSDSIFARSPLTPIRVNLSRERRSSSGFSRVSRPSGLSRTRSLGLDAVLSLSKHTPSATRPAVASALKLTPMPLTPQDWGDLRGSGVGVEANPSAFHVQLATQAAGHLGTLRAGLQGDNAALAGAVRSLLGFGEGLTPAGDDCLLGVLAARRMSGQPAGLLEATIRSSAPRTTSLSAAFLRAACDGQFAGHWHRLRDALAHGEAAEIEEAARCILAHGATSGADALVGWVVGLASRRA